MDLDRSEVLYQFSKNRGLLGIQSKLPVRDEYMLSLLYTPGVAEPCRRIAENVSTARDYTIKGNAVALLSDASHEAVSRFGSHGLIPFLESHALMCRELAAVDAYPFSLDTDSDEGFVESAVNLEPGVGVLALDYVSFPRVLELEVRIAEQVEIPVLNLGGEVLATLLMVGFHNAARYTGCSPGQLQVLLYGVNAATFGLHRLARHSPFSVCLVDPEGEHRALDEGIAGSVPEEVSWQVVVNCRDQLPELALEEQSFLLDLAPGDHDGERFSGSYHFWNRRDLSFHPALIFPGLFRGLLDCRLTSVPEDFWPEIACEVASLQDEEILREGRLFPQLLELHTAPTVSRTIARLAARSFPDRHFPDPEASYELAMGRVYTGGRAYMGSGAIKRSERTRSTEELAQTSLELHQQYQGAIEIYSKLPLRDEFVLKILSPPCLNVPAEEIIRRPLSVFEYSSKSNLVAVITDGSAVLGLGNIGPEAGLPVMEGKALLLKTLAGVEAFPVCLRSQDPDVIVRVAAALQPILGGINLEDISAPRCFQVEERLRDITDIPVFHDDQHGTAVVVLAGILNGTRYLGLRLEDLSIVINGAGASAIAVARLLVKSGVGEIVLCDTRGAIHRGRTERMNEAKELIAGITNREGKRGSLEEVIRGARVFIGLSQPDILRPGMIRTMADDPLIFALANPNPEILPDQALEAGAAVVATGRSDFRNQINNSLAFPGIFRGALDARARNINDEMKIAAARAIAFLVPDRELRKDYIIPHALDSRVAPQVAASVAHSALETGQARVLVEPRVVRDNTREFLYGGRLDPVVGEPL